MHTTRHFTVFHGGKIWVLVLPFSAANQMTLEKSHTFYNLSLQTSKRLSPTYLCSHLDLLLYSQTFKFTYSYVYSQIRLNHPLWTYSPTRMLRISHNFYFRVFSNCLGGDQHEIWHSWGLPIP